MKLKPVSVAPMDVTRIYQLAKTSTQSPQWKHLLPQPLPTLQEQLTVAANVAANKIYDNVFVLKYKPAASEKPSWNSFIDPQNLLTNVVFSFLKMLSDFC